MDGAGEAHPERKKCQVAKASTLHGRAIKLLALNMLAARETGPAAVSAAVQAEYIRQAQCAVKSSRARLVGLARKHKKPANYAAAECAVCAAECLVCDDD
jgi:hypothetical protein